jgi:hypothetical protein
MQHSQSGAGISKMVKRPLSSTLNKSLSSTTLKIEQTQKLPNVTNVEFPAAEYIDDQEFISPMESSTPVNAEIVLYRERANSRAESARSDDYKQSYNHAAGWLRVDASKISISTYDDNNVLSDSFPNSPNTTSRASPLEDRRDSHPSLQPPLPDYVRIQEQILAPITDELSIDSESVMKSPTRSHLQREVLQRVPSADQKIIKPAVSVLRPLRNSVPLNRSFRATVSVGQKNHP